MNEKMLSRGVEGIVTGCGSVMNIHFVAGPISSPSQLELQDKRLHHLFQIEMALRGQYVTSRGMLAMSLPIDAAVVDQFLEAFDGFLDDHRSILPSRKQTGGRA